MIPIITFFVGAQLVAPVISVSVLLANPSRAYLFRRHIDWRVIIYLLPGSMIGAIMGAWSLTLINNELIQILLGLFLISYVLQDKFGRSQLGLQDEAGFVFSAGLNGLFSFRAHQYHWSCL